jgi:hypothetical protein
MLIIHTPLLLRSRIIAAIPLHPTQTPSQHVPQGALKTIKIQKEYIVSIL